VRHRDGHIWTVQEILCEWKHPGTAPDHLAEPGVVRCKRPRVLGPLPGDTARRGEFISRPQHLWLISPGPQGCACGESWTVVSIGSQVLSIEAVLKGVARVAGQRAYYSTQP
jgi:hypothetical protein